MCDTTDLLDSVTDPTLTTTEAAPWVRQLEAELRAVAGSFRYRPGPDRPPSPARPKPRPTPQAGLTGANRTRIPYRPRDWASRHPPGTVFSPPPPVPAAPVRSTHDPLHFLAQFWHSSTTPKSDM